MMRAVRVGFACFALMGTVSCQKPSGPSAQMNQAILQLESRVMPPGFRVISRSEPTLNKITFRAEWEFETDWSKERYEAWVKNELSSDFKSLAKPSGLLFTRYNDGEAQSIEIASGAKNGKLRVHAIFLSYPD